VEHSEWIWAKPKITLQKRYAIKRGITIGDGSMSIVYKGLDTKECRNVAVKVYRNSDDEAIQSFEKSLNVLKAIAGKDSECSFANSPLDLSEVESLVGGRGAEEELRSNNSCKKPDSRGPRYDARSSFNTELLDEDIQKVSQGFSTDALLADMDFSSCFIRPFGHSLNEEGEPGLDPDFNCLYIIFELGELSLEEYIDSCRDQGRTLSVSELRDLHWALVTIVCGLHCRGLVHLDIKPCNVMRFKSKSGRPQWRLIDLDGALEAGSVVSPEDVTITPLYMPPEVAASLGKIRVSRLMDVWSVGMCALQAIFFQPILSPWYREWMEETGTDEKFYKWLSDYKTEAILSGDMRQAVSAIDDDMCDLLDGMLTKDPAKRLGITACLSHPWFSPVRDNIIHTSTTEAGSPPPQSASRVQWTSDCSKVATRMSSQVCTSM